MELTLPRFEDSLKGRFDQADSALARLRARLSGLPEAQRAEVQAMIARAEAQAELMNGMGQVLAEMSANPPIVVETLELRVDPAGG